MTYILRFVSCLLLFASTAQGQVDTTRRQFPLDVIRSRCIDFRNLSRGTESSQIRDCRVSNFGEFGRVGAKAYYYATYCIIPNYAEKGMCGDTTFTAQYHQTRGLAIFAKPTGRKKADLLFERVSEELGIYRYDIKPEIVRNRFGTLLYVPIIVDGTGNGNESEYYLLDAGAWKRIEFDGWFTDLRKRLPPGVEIRKGVWPDLHTMRAEADLYKEGDANCCSSAGVAKIKLAIHDKKFTLDSVWLENPPR